MGDAFRLVCAGVGDVLYHATAQPGGAGVWLRLRICTYQRFMVSMLAPRGLMPVAVSYAAAWQAVVCAGSHQPMSSVAWRREMDAVQQRLCTLNGSVEWHLVTQAIDLQVIRHPSQACPTRQGGKSSHMLAPHMCAHWKYNCPAVALSMGHGGHDCAICCCIHQGQCLSPYCQSIGTCQHSQLLYTLLASQLLLNCTMPDAQQAQQVAFSHLTWPSQSAGSVRHQLLPPA